MLLIVNDDDGDNNNYVMNIDGGMQPRYFPIFWIILFDSADPSSNFRRHFSTGRLETVYLNR